MKIFRQPIPAARMACLVALAAQALSVVAYAKKTPTQYYVQQMEYVNHGAYTAFLVVYWVAADGNTYHKRQGIAIENGETQMIDLTKLLDRNGQPIPEGALVWSKVGIIFGETKDCRKDDRIFYYKASGQGKGGSVRFRTKGETYTNNRCRIVSDPDIQHIVPPQDAPSS